CARQTADLALRDQVRWAVAIFGAWQESLPADRDAMPTATAQRRSARSVALMARGALQEGIAFVLEREPGTLLMRSIIRQGLGDRDEDGAVEVRAGHLTVRDRDALRVLAAGATQLAETYRDPSTRRGPKLDAALVELVGRLVPVIEDRLGPDSVRTWFDE